MDTKITFAQIDQIYLSLKTQKFSKISVHTLTYKLLSQIELDDSHLKLVRNAVTSFFHKEKV